MARPKEFDELTALEATIGVFREHGFAGTSATMLVGALGIGRQSLYDTFGDKWQLYVEAVRKYSSDEVKAHIAVLQAQPQAIDGIRMMLERVVQNAKQACLGVSSICEFGASQPQLAEIHQTCGQALHTVLVEQIRKAQNQGAMTADNDAETAAEFLVANIAAMRLAARGGAGKSSLSALASLALRALH